MIPTANGAMLGDIIQTEKPLGGEIQLRTFIGGKAGFVGEKDKLRNDLLSWQDAYKPMFPIGLQFSSVNRENLFSSSERNEFERECISDLHGFASVYLDILQEHPRALDDREVRTERAQLEYRKWQR
jgi:hypothetical protein